MTKDKALDLALEALEELQPDDAYPYSLQSKAITAIKKARSAPVQEPVAWVRLEAWQSGAEWPDDCFTGIPADGLTPLYTTPPAAQEDIQRLSALVRAQQITIDKLEQDRSAPVQKYLGVKPCWYESKEEKMCPKCGQVHAGAIFSAAQRPVAEPHKWVGLTDEEIGALDYSGTRAEFVKAIEAKLKEKNNG